MSASPSAGDRGGIENGLGSSDDIDDPHGFVQHGGVDHGLETSGDGVSVEDDGLEHGLGSSDGTGGSHHGAES